MQLRGLENERAYFFNVPMYFNRWKNDLLNEKIFYRFYDGIEQLNIKWIVTYNIVDWKNEISWMTLYFSFAVWVRLLLCYVPTVDINQKD